MKRHGNFDKLPKAEEKITLVAARLRFPGVFSSAPLKIAFLKPDSPVELETSTGAMTVYDKSPGGANWVYFPGEGWDGY